MQQTLKTHFALNLSAHNKFYLNRAFIGLFWLRSDSSKVVLILHEYWNIYCIIVSLTESFWAPTSLKKSLRKKTKSFCQVVPKSSLYRACFCSEVTLAKLFWSERFIWLWHIIISLRDSFGAPICLKNSICAKTKSL